MRLLLTRHAREVAERRNIPEELIRRVAQQPEQRLVRLAGGVTLQGRFFDPLLGKTMLLRIIVEETAEEIRILTVYKTSRIDKYWEGEEAKP